MNFADLKSVLKLELDRDDVASKGPHLTTVLRQQKNEKWESFDATSRSGRGVGLSTRARLLRDRHKLRLHALYTRAAEPPLVPSRKGIHDKKFTAKLMQGTVLPTFVEAADHLKGLQNIELLLEIVNFYVKFKLTYARKSDVSWNAVPEDMQALLTTCRRSGPCCLRGHIPHMGAKSIVQHRE